MSSRINDILTLEDQLQQESISHLQIKADLSQKFSDLSLEETSLSQKLMNLEKKIQIEQREEPVSVDTSHLLQTKAQLDEEISQLSKEIAILDQHLSQIKADRSIIDSKIVVLVQEKKKQEKITQEVPKSRTLSVRVSSKLQNEREKLQKIRNQITRQEGIKENLNAFLKSLGSIKEVISDYSPIKESKSSLSAGITPEIQAKIINAKKRFDEAQTSFDPNNLVPFLIDANEAYQNIVSAFIELCEILPNSLLELDFNSQVLTLVEKGLMLNTRHLNAVKSMLSKLEKGVEIAPLASFSNEIRRYFIENLTYLKVTGWVVLEE